MSKVQLIEVKSEIGAGTRGASLGIDAIKMAALNKKDDFFKQHPSIDVPVENQLLGEQVTTPNAKRISGLVKIYERISEVVSKTVADGKFPLVIAGDHSTAGGTIAGIKKAYPGKRLGVVWIDAHADLHSPYTTPSGNLHGMPVATALGIDNLEQKRNTIVEETKLGWEKLKSIGGIVPKILPQDLVFVALRDTEGEEDYIINNSKIRVIRVSEVRDKGPAYTVHQILQELDKTDIIYVSFDVDSLDMEISVGTGTPVANGLEVEEAKIIIEGLVASPKTICFELVEVNPLLDDEGNKMAEIAFDIIKEAHQQIDKK